MTRKRQIEGGRGAKGATESTEGALPAEDEHVVARPEGPGPRGTSDPEPLPAEGGAASEIGAEREEAPEGESTPEGDLALQSEESSEAEAAPEGEEALEAQAALEAEAAVPVDPDRQVSEVGFVLGDDDEIELAPRARPGLEKAPPLPTGEAHLKGILESLLFVTDKPLPPNRLAKIARASTKEVQRLLDVLTEEYRGRGLELVEVAGGYQFRSSAENAPFVRELVARKPVRLTRAQIETLSILAYRQPITRPEIDEVRGVDSGSALKVLLEKTLVRIIGRKEEPGRPLLYGTTAHVL
ncbi:MAG: SMC-Scp complex subunit ScpB, partial [Deltaproteobacteria bacterium]